MVLTLLAFSTAQATTFDGAATAGEISATPPSYVTGRILAVNETLGRTDWIISVDDRLGPAAIHVPETITIRQAFGCSPATQECVEIPGEYRNVTLDEGTRVMVDVRELRLGSNILAFVRTNLYFDSAGIAIVNKTPLHGWDCREGATVPTNKSDLLFEAALDGQRTIEHMADARANAMTWTAFVGAVRTCVEGTAPTEAGE